MDRFFGVYERNSRLVRDRSANHQKSFVPEHKLKKKHEFTEMILMLDQKEVPLHAVQQTEIDKLDQGTLAQVVGVLLFIFRQPDMPDDNVKSPVEGDYPVYCCRADSGTSGPHVFEAIDLETELDEAKEKEQI